jgi:glutaredoxin 2
MIGQKMVPILQKDDSRYMAESMDIVHYVDRLDGTRCSPANRTRTSPDWLRKVNGYVNQLLLPRFAEAAFDEFSTPSARRYLYVKKRRQSAALPTISPIRRG